MQYADTPAAWDRVVAACRRAGRVGFDTETYGHDIRSTSAPHRARIHVWSLAVSTGKLHPRGFYRAKGVMLPAAALEYRPLVELLEDPGVVKLAHNLPHDVHSARNHGIVVAGGIDTLPRARLTLVDELSHSLKPLMERKLGRTVITFEQVLTEPNVIEVSRRTKRRVCSCGADACRLRKGHEKSVVVDEWTEWVVRGTRLMPLESVVPGHERFDLLTRYAIQDAEGVLELDGYLDRAELHYLRQRGDVEIPWAA